MDDRITDTQSPQASASTNSAIRAISRLPDDVSQILGVESSDGGTHVATPGEAQAGVIADESLGVRTNDDPLGLIAMASRGSPCTCNWCTDPEWRHWHCARCGAKLDRWVSGEDMDVCKPCEGAEDGP